MCKFCKNLELGNKIILNGRNLSAKDNFYKSLNINKENFERELFNFSLKGMKSQNGNTYIMLDYLLELKNKKSDEKVIVNSFTESIQLNFCPMCGSQLSKETVEFEVIR